MKHSRFSLIVFLAIILSMAFGADASAQRFPDSLSTAALGIDEGTLQDLLDDLGYNIDVANDELGLEVFCAPDGFNTATMVLEVAGSAASANSGYYEAGVGSNMTQLFGPSDGPGSSVTFTIPTTISSIGFYMEPNLSNPSDVWYSETSLNSDAFDHFWVFPTGTPKEYVIAFEDLANGGDEDYQDLVIKVVFDYVDPVLYGCPANLTVECDAVPTAATVTATADCDPSPVVTFTETSAAGACPQEYTLTRTWTATDMWGGTASCSQTVTVVDTTPPVISCPADIDVLCDDPTDPPFTGTATATDNCTAVGDIVIAYSDAGTGTISRTWTATDECGNQASCVQTITATGDIDPPELICPPDFAVECIEDIPSPAPGMITSTDNCDPNPVVTFVSETQNGTTCPIIITRTFRATDASGNWVECSQTITIDDQTPPVLTGCPADLAINCDDPVPPPAAVAATDNCSGVTLDFTQTQEALNPLECTWEIIITRTWIATDLCGNQASCVQTITVEDNEAPSITCPGPIVVECAGDVPAPDVSLVTTSDNCDPEATVVFIKDTSDGLTCPETITRMYRAHDDCGNMSFCTQTITIDDTMPPVVTGPADLVLDCVGDIPQPNVGLVTATDNCDVSPVIIFVDDVVNGSGCPMTITRTYRATDDCGNFAECSQTITVDDQIPPQIACPTDLTVECMGDVPAQDIGMVTASDNCGAAPLVEWVSDSPAGSCPTIITRLYRATDDCGNEAFCQQIITVDDQTLPVISGCLADATVACDNVPALAAVTASDNCPGVTLDFVQTEDAGSCPQESIITRTWTATDACGNQSTCIRVITVQDNVDPQITCPADVTVNCLSEVPAADIGLVTVSDNCDPDPQVTVLADQQSGNCPIIITRTYRATDACGNSADCIQTITVDDQEAPVFSLCPADVAVECGHIPEIPVITATDNCDGDVAVDFSEGVVPGNPCVYTYTLVRTWTAVDVCGNVATCEQRIDIEDVIAPEIVCPVADTVECLEDVPAPDLVLVSASDNCDPAPVIEYVGDEVIGYQCPWVVERTYRATDACGNSDTCVQSFVVDDITPPVLTLPADESFTLCEPTEICLPVSATDNCWPPTVFEVGDGPGAIDNGQWCYTPAGSGSFDVTIHAEDTCGNAVDEVFHVDVIMNTAPEITNCPDDATIHWGETFLHDFVAFDPDASQTLTFDLCETTPEAVSMDAAGHLTWSSGPEDICDPTICVIVTDDCGAVDTCTFDICVTNSPPVVTCPEDATICNGYPFAAQVTATDPDGGPTAFFRLVSGPAGVTVDDMTGEIAWEAPEPGSWDICVEASDGAPVCDPCSPANADTCCFTLNVVALDLVIEKVHKQYQNQQAEVSIDFLHQGSNWPIGGYDLLIQYDASVLNFSKATEGEFFLDCEWEYFTYRFGASGNCGVGACPTGMLRIVAMAETTGGNLANHPDCFTNDGLAVPGPGSSTSTQLAVMHFMVTDDRTAECTFAPIRFMWYDCGDNALSNVTGDTLYISNEVYDYGGEVGEPPVVVWNQITGLDNVFPTLTGAPSPDCDLSEKTELVRCANFHNGGVDIICADSIDAAGDVNLNGIAYEIADAVMLTNYFISGLGAFEPHVEGSIAASDANRDGLALSVSDLVFVIRVVIGDAMPYAKVAPNAEQVSYTLENGVIATTSNIDISGAALVVQGMVEPQLLTDGMSMRYAYDGSVTRIVVTPAVEGANMTSFQGEFLGGISRELVSIELATSEGAMVLAKNVPVSFGLTQNYPNPFNPATTIEFALPEPTEYTLTIFNIQGQMVGSHSGRADAAGIFRFEWDASEKASGVYLYRLEAGSFSQTKKMLLLK